MNLEKIKRAFSTRNFRYTKHGLEQRIKRHIAAPEINEAIQKGEIIENYPDDKYGPSCLILGFTNNNIPLHVQIAFQPIISIVTVYKPDPKEWIDYKIRRR